MQFTPENSACRKGKNKQVEKTTDLRKKFLSFAQKCLTKIVHYATLSKLRGLRACVRLTDKETVVFLCDSGIYF